VVSGVQNRGLRMLEMSLKKRDSFSTKECEPIRNLFHDGEPEVNSKVEEWLVRSVFFFLEHFSFEYFSLFNVSQ
jgi:hypothetical protein